jgi:hypothetical protein
LASCWVSHSCVKPTTSLGFHVFQNPRGDPRLQSVVFGLLQAANALGDSAAYGLSWFKQVVHGFSKELREVGPGCFDG